METVAVVITGPTGLTMYTHDAPKCFANALSWLRMCTYLLTYAYSWKKNLSCAIPI